MDSSSRMAAAIRWIVWKLVRLPDLPWLMAETGAWERHAILSRNLLAAAFKPMPAADD